MQSLRIDLDKSLHVELEADMCKYTGYYIKNVIFFVISNKKQNESVKRTPQKADQIIVYY